MFAFITSRRNFPRGRQFSASSRAGLSTLMPYSGNRAGEAAFLRCPPLACGLEPIRRVPVGASAFSSGRNRALRVEQFFGLVAAHPVFELLQVAPGSSLTSAIGTWCERQRSFELVPADFRGAGPPFGVRRTIIGQRGRNAVPLLRALLLERPDVGDALVDRRGHRLMHRLAGRTLRRSTASSRSPRKGFDFLVGDASPDRRVVDLVPVEMQDRQHGAVADRIQELVDVPATSPAGRFRIRRRRRPPRRSDRDYRTPHRTHARGHSRVRRLHESSRAFPACSGCRCRRERKTV